MLAWCDYISLSLNIHFMFILQLTNAKFFMQVIKLKFIISLFTQVYIHTTQKSKTVDKLKKCAASWPNKNREIPTS